MALIAEALAEIGDVFEAAIAGSDDPLAAVAAAYRGWALAHPHLYRLMMDRPLPRERLPAGLEDRAAAALVAATGGDPDAARAAFAFAHGMVVLELNGRFPPAPTSKQPGSEASTRSARSRPQASSGPHRGDGPDTVAGKERDATALVAGGERRQLDAIVEVDRVAVVERGSVW